jgi:uncharacterized membrane protein
MLCMHAVFAFAAVPLFLGTLLSDWAYASSYQIQWTNFADWLIAGGLVLTGMALLSAAINAVSERTLQHRPVWLYLLLLLGTFVLGFINALIHAKDAWAAMPAGLILSVIVFVVAAAASWLGLDSMRGRRPAAGAAT